MRFGKVTRPILGIKFAPDQSVEQLGVSGVLVLDAPPNGPAGKAVLIPYPLFIGFFSFWYYLKLKLTEERLTFYLRSSENFYLFGVSNFME